MPEGLRVVASKARSRSDQGWGRIRGVGAGGQQINLNFLLDINDHIIIISKLRKFVLIELSL